MIDFHTHILPRIDDGSKSIEMSLAMLTKLKGQGADSVVLTPHYYFTDENIEVFIKRREKALNDLLNEASDFPDLYIAAEVAFFSGMSGLEDIEKLCIKGTNYMMLEMPYGKWSKQILQEVDALYLKRDIVPIIVHPERFINYQRGTDYIKRLLQMDVMVQMNCEAMEGKFFNREGLNLFKEGYVDIIGSDCHNMTDRAPNFDLGIKYILNKFGTEKIKEIEMNGKEILNDAVKVNNITSV